MPIGFLCSDCGKAMRAREERAGHRVRCRDCGAVTVVPTEHSELDELPRLPPASGQPIDPRRYTERPQPPRVERTWLPLILKSLAAIVAAMVLIGVIGFLAQRGPDKPFAEDPLIVGDEAAAEAVAAREADEANAASQRPAIVSGGAGDEAPGESKQDELRQLLRDEAVRVQQDDPGYQSRRRVAEFQSGMRNSVTSKPLVVEGNRVVAAGGRATDEPPGYFEPLTREQFDQAVANLEGAGDALPDDVEAVWQEFVAQAEAASQAEQATTSNGDGPPLGLATLNPELVGSPRMLEPMTREELDGKLDSLLNRDPLEGLGLSPERMAEIRKRAANQSPAERLARARTTLDGREMPPLSGLRAAWRNQPNNWSGAAATSDATLPEIVGGPLDAARFRPLVADGSAESVGMAPAGGPFVLIASGQATAGTIDMRDGSRVGPPLPETVNGIKVDWGETMLSPTGRTAATAISGYRGDPARLILFDVVAGQPRHLLRMDGRSSVCPLSVQDDRVLLLASLSDEAEKAAEAAGEDARDRLVLVETERGVSLYDRPCDYKASLVVIGKANRRSDRVSTDAAGTRLSLIESIAADPTLTLFDIATGETIAQHDTPGEWGIKAAALSPSGRLLALSSEPRGDQPPAIYVVDATTGELRDAMLLPQPASKFAPVLYDYGGAAVEFFPNEDFLLVGGLEVWSLPLGRPVAILTDLVRPGTTMGNGYPRVPLTNGLGLVDGSFSKTALAFLPLPLDAITETIDAAGLLDPDGGASSESLLRPGDRVRVVVETAGPAMEESTDGEDVLRRWGSQIATSVGLVPVDETDAADAAAGEPPRIDLVVRAKTAVGPKTGRGQLREMVLKASLELSLVRADGPGTKRPTLWSQTIDAPGGQEGYDAKTPEQLASQALTSLSFHLGKARVPYYLSESGPVRRLPVEVPLTDAVP